MKDHAVLPRTRISEIRKMGRGDRATIEHFGLEDGPEFWRYERSIFHAEPRNHCLCPGGTERARYEWVIKFIPEGARVLDIGCNCGQFAQNLVADRGCEVVGIDIVDDFIQNNRKSKPGVAWWLNADFGKMTIPQVTALGLFDVVTALEVIEHPINIWGFRRNVHIALEFCGKLIVTTPCPEDEIHGYEYMRSHPHHVRMWTKLRLEMIFGPMLACEQMDYNGTKAQLGAVWEWPFRTFNQYNPRD